jgi:hypothetical protein
MDNNVIDFFQAASDERSVCASVPSVYVDGKWCDFLVVENITLAAEPDFSQAVLSYYSSDNNLLPEEIGSVVNCGQRIVITSIYDTGTGVVRLKELPIFAGIIEDIDIETRSGEQKIKIIAKDFSARLKRKTVYGRNVCQADGELIFIAGVDTVFNLSGEPNASSQNIIQNSRSFKAFATSDNEGEFFSCADAIYYLLCSYVSAGELVIPSLEQLKTLTGGANILDVDVQGQNLIEALRRCCRQAGLTFKFVPSAADSGIAEAIVFFKPDNCREIELNCQWQGQRLDIAKTNIAEVSREQYPCITNRYVVAGDYKIYEATFELVKGWDTSLEENDYDKFSPTTNENFNDVRDVWRKWVLNEAGDYIASPYNQGDAFDFSDIFENNPYIRRKRKFMSCLSCGQSGTSLGYYLEVSYTNGSYWWPYMSSFKVLADECGIWLSIEQFDTDMWFAILKGVLKFRITASVMSDERINFAVADGPVNSTAEVVDKIITLPRRFKYRKVSPQSIFTDKPDGNLGVADEADDISEIVEYARGLSDLNRSQTERLKIKTLLLSNIFSPGDRITTSPDSRDILGVGYDGRRFCFIEKVEMNFAEQQTILTTVKKRK